VAVLQKIQLTEQSSFKPKKASMKIRFFNVGKKITGC
jgi:hypothetical protein